MLPLRARTLCVCLSALAAAALVSGCASGRLSPQAPPGTRLAGDWKLDRSRSDHLGAALAQLRAEERKREHERSSRRTGGMSGYGEGGAGGDEGDESGRRGERAGGQGRNPAEVYIGPAPRISAADELMSSVPQGEYLRITESPSAFGVTSGAASNQYTPGLQSEVSAQKGSAQQMSGWKDGDYVIDTRPQWGPEIIQRYGLTKDGRLSLTVRLTGKGTDFTFTRIYQRTTRVPPLAPPTND